jgi:hypothetical protein
MSRVRTISVAAMAAATAVCAVAPAPAAQANAKVNDRGTTYQYDGGGVDRFFVTALGTGVSAPVSFVPLPVIGGVAIDGTAPCVSQPTWAECVGRKPVVADLGDMDDQMELASSSPPGTVHAGPGNDRIFSQFAALTAYGDDGDDTIKGGTTGDTIDGGAGDDLLYGTTGADDVHGGSGTDTVQYSPAAGVTVSLDDVANDGTVAPFSNVHSDVENITGGYGDDHLIGDAAANVLLAGPGADTVEGGDGADTIDCGDGTDVALVDPSDTVTNCETIEYVDVDHDGFTSDRDCDDHDASAHPGAREAPGDGVDQDCSGADAPPIVVYAPAAAAATAPGHVMAGVNASWLVRERYTKVARLVVEDVPAGAQVSVNGKSVTVIGAKAYLTKRFKGRKLRPGRKIVLRITAPGMVGRTVTFTIRSRKLPAKTVA